MVIQSNTIVMDSLNTGSGDITAIDISSLSSSIDTTMKIINNRISIYNEAHFGIHANGVSKALIRDNSVLMHANNNGDVRGIQLENGTKNLIEHNTKLTPVEKEAQIAEIPKKIDGMMAADPWMKFFLTYDPAITMRRVKTPVLILTGSNDQQAVPGQVAVQESAFKSGGNKNVTVQVLPGLNHLFVEDSDGFPGNYAKLPPPVMMRTDVVKLVTDWLVKQLR